MGSNDMSWGPEGLLDFDHLFATIRATRQTHVVVELELTALGANLDRSLELQSVVGTAHALAAFRSSFLWNGHDFT